MLLLERLMISSDAFEVNVCSECGLNGKNTRYFPYLEISFLWALVLRDVTVKTFLAGRMNL